MFMTNPDGFSDKIIVDASEHSNDFYVATPVDPKSKPPSFRRGPFYLGLYYFCVGVT
ncbi:hypothetical protein DES52_1232 [Deinococcus yavapaiensis KR-236]|uniref:Uncharacterized protein n=1 Tax=Deinococcus yavapaiensis KR-236 TaxID=694435 RepID=A0A318RZN7_9DEIO|nr:hypothetical protein DES52_1232 [Deinococcus yavapaiensis KR-236]